MISRIGATGCAYKETMCDKACWEPNTLDICTQIWSATFLNHVEPGEVPPTAILPNRIDRSFGDPDNHLEECLSGECKQCLVVLFTRSTPKPTSSDARLTHSYA